MKKISRYKSPRSMYCRLIESLKLLALILAMSAISIAIIVMLPSWLSGLITVLLVAISVVIWS